MSMSISTKSSSSSIRWQRLGPLKWRYRNWVVLQSLKTLRFYLYKLEQAPEQPNLNDIGYRTLEKVGTAIVEMSLPSMSDIYKDIPFVATHIRTSTGERVQYLGLAISRENRADVVIYRREDGCMYTLSVIRFFDGRFKEIGEEIYDGED